MPPVSNCRRSETGHDRLHWKNHQQLEAGVQAHLACRSKTLHFVVQKVMLSAAGCSELCPKQNDATMLVEFLLDFLEFIEVITAPNLCFWNCTILPPKILSSPLVCSLNRSLALVPTEPTAAGRPVLVGMKNRNQTRYHDVMKVTNTHRYNGHLSSDIDTSRTSTVAIE